MREYEELRLYSEILPGLWQGGTDDFDTLAFPITHVFQNREKQFDAVATFYASAHPVGWEISERRFGFPDAELNERNLPEIHSIAEWAFQQWKSGKKVLIRCQAGLNRSGLCTALILMKNGMSSNDAISLIREKRSENALFNVHFVNYLNSLNMKDSSGLTNLAS